MLHVTPPLEAGAVSQFARRLVRLLHKSFFWAWLDTVCQYRRSRIGPFWETINVAVMVFGLTLRVLNRETGFRRGVALGILGVWAHLAVHSMFNKLYVDNMPLHLGVMFGIVGGLLIYRWRNDGYSRSLN